MEGVGSRFGRASSRYGSAPTPAVFSGPVRKWKKQWVVTQPSAHRNTANANNAAAPSLLLCRWIPLPSAASGDSAQPQMSPKRKFRYAPIVDLEEKKREALKKVENEANTRKMDKAASSATLGGGNMLKKHNINDIFNEDFQRVGKTSRSTSSALGTLCSIYNTMAELVIRIPEILEEVWDVVSKHVVYSLHHFRLQPFELVNAVATQDFLEVFNTWEIPCRQMMLPLNLFVKNISMEPHFNFKHSSCKYAC
nr:uncharacterized protein LOC109190452 [Ipomoea batatas]